MTMADQNLDNPNPRPDLQTASGEGGLGARSYPQGAAAEANASSGTNAGIGKDDQSGANLKETGSRMADEVKHHAEDIAGQAKEQGRATFEQKKERAAAQVDSVAQAFRSTAGQLQDDTPSPVGRYINMAAEQLESFGHRLREKDMGTLVKDTQELARRSPGAFFAGSVVAGFLFSRFLKSSAQGSYEGAERDDNAYSSYPENDFENARSVRRPEASDIERNSVASSPVDDTFGNDNVDTHGVRATTSGSDATGIGADGTGTGVPPSSPGQDQSGGNSYGNR